VENPLETSALGTPAELPGHYVAKAKELVGQMTLEEKAMLLSGDGWWATHRLDRLQLASISITDGPHGVRKGQGAGLTTSLPATCFPTASALACSWDAGLIEQIGVALGQESQACDVQVLLGPGINMKRSPLGGRNFEYFSEDPLLAGKLAAAYIKGVQSQGVGTSLKHYAVNNQEFERMVTSSNLDERTLHEVYLPAFEIAVKEAQPWTVMSSYNLVNGVYASEHRQLLQDILRESWGFAGLVVSDWGGVNDRVAGLAAGTDLEMPGSGDYNRRKIVEAVQNGGLPAADVDRSAERVLALALTTKHSHKENARLDAEQNHSLARRAAGESVVLLKNLNGVLPLRLEQSQKIAIIGAFAKMPRYQGAGSSQVNPTKISNAYEELVKIAGDAAKFGYASGYTTQGDTTELLLEEARQVAASSNVAIVFAGLPDSYESEGFDRSSLDLPAGHNRLIEAISDVQSNIIVVLMNGSAVTMPWAERAQAILEGWLGGQAGGGGIADVLSGKVNPSGKLAETFPKRLEDTPAFPNFPGRNGQAYYGEGVFIGYRYYDKKNIEPLFPFGHGLSYTKFEYTGITVTPSSIKDSNEVRVDIAVKNAGTVAGKEIVQLYVHEEKSPVVRPEKELKAFEKVALAPGQEKSITFNLSKRDFAFYDTVLHDWNVSSGRFDISVGGSSRDLPLKATIEVQNTRIGYAKLTRTSMLKEFRDHPKGNAHYPRLLEAAGLDTSSKKEEAKTLSVEEAAAKEKGEMAMRAFLDDMPANKLPAFSEGEFTLQELDEILRQVE
jgi:beta-glucosidase